jgi:hypothetical protein
VREGSRTFSSFYHIFSDDSTVLHGKPGQILCGFSKKFEPKEAVPKDGFALFRRYARNRRRRSARRARGDFTVMIFIGTPQKTGAI